MTAVAKRRQSVHDFQHVYRAYRSYETRMQISGVVSIKKTVLSDHQAMESKFSTSLKLNSNRHLTAVTIGLARKETFSHFTNQTSNVPTESSAGRSMINI